MAKKVAVKVDERELLVSNLDKELYPDYGFTKAEVIDYYSRIAPVLLPHLTGRPLTVKRYPHGVDGHFFFEKSVSRRAPEWIRRINLPVPGSTKNRESIDFAVVDNLPTLVYYANLAALELHVPQWRVDDDGRVLPPDLIVFDLDPGPPATIVECCEIALALREVLRSEGLDSWAKTSGSKGMQLYAHWDGREEPSEYARRLARLLEKHHPKRVVSVMTKTARPGKIFIDWDQNSPAKTTVAPYSLRARARPTVSTPLTWKEVESCERPQDLVFTAPDVLSRVEKRGDLFGRA
ncbi:non-homologous end-joining DNA ligase [Nonomuraea sp. NPDC050783]|uniref:non-homologous end-joining DNA ligase n=1 Tax=Nonomuraea sp. NPDC050783 TaxID=3154634 RepID=UPI0034672538